MKKLSKPFFINQNNFCANFFLEPVFEERKLNKIIGSATGKH
jgi:hypothetical protein